MAVEIVNFNGLSPYLNYNTFQHNAEKFFSTQGFDTKIAVFNNFPIALSSQTSIDLLLFIKSENTFNKSLPYPLNNRSFKNIIIPIKIANKDNFEGVLTEDLDEDLVAEIFSSDITSMNLKLVDYLKDKCDFSEVRVEPLIYVKFGDENYQTNILFSPQLDIESILNYLIWKNYKVFSSYNKWTTSNFDTFIYDIKRVVDNASKDSEYGYLTKKKLDYIARKRKSSENIFDEIGAKTIVIDGKAGTGKTLELMNIASRKIESGKNILYLSYNSLLINDVAKTLYHRRNLLIANYRNNSDPTKEIIGYKVGDATVSTIHHYIFHLVRSLGVALIINSDRIKELFDNLDNRTKEVSDFLNNSINPALPISFKDLKTLVQNNKKFNIEVKEAGVLLLNFLEKKKYKERYSLFENVKHFIEDRKEFLIKNFQNEVFLSDYHNILNQTLKLLTNSNDFYDEYDVGKKGKILEMHFKLSINETESFTQGNFSKKISKRLVARLRGRTIFIDEAHDCTKIERDILMKIFGFQRFVVSSGGKEQLIRTGEVLSWTVSSGFNHPTKTFKKDNRTFRMKSNIVHLVNFIAQKFNINIDLIADSEIDSGTLTFDFRIVTESNLKLSIREYLDTAFIAGYSPYESLLYLIDSRTDHITRKEGEKEDYQLVITAENNISESKVYKREWRYISILNDTNNYSLWNGTISNKSNLALPQNFDIRAIYYESCRGLEAHTVFCFALDQYFNHKRNDDQASLYLLQDMFTSDEDRKNAYAITTVIMALTRAIDSLYINIIDENSLLGELLLEYSNLYPNRVRLLKDIS